MFNAFNVSSYYVSITLIICSSDLQLIDLETTIEQIDWSDVSVISI